MSLTMHRATVQSHGTRRSDAGVQNLEGGGGGDTRILT